MKFETYRQYDALGLAQLVQQKEVSPNELLETAISRAEAVNPTLNAIVYPLYDYAKEMLEKMPNEGIFSGVPFLIKDLGLFVENAPMSVGSRFLKNYICKDDSLIVQKLRAAGFLFFGKTNTPEFGLTPFTEAQLYQACHNPWNLAHSPGGSSGGSAAAVASGIVPMATASDGGGSIRMPASCCGLVGLKPSRGVSSNRPHLAQAWGGLVVEGCNSRSVRDTAAYLDVISGNGLGEFHVLQGKPKQSFSAQLEKPVEKLKIGFSSQHPMGLPIDKVCQKAVAHSAKLLSDLGHEVQEVSLPFQAADLVQVFLKIVSAEAAADLRLWTKTMGRKPKRSEIEPNTWTLSLLGNTFSAADYAYAWTEAGAIARRLADWHKTYDVLLTPTLANAPIKTGALQNNAAENILVNIINTFSLGSLLKASIKPFAEKAFGYIGYSPIANMTGQPAISLPLYHDEATNLPIGTMFSTKIGDDALLLRLAKQLEEAQPWFNKIPSVAGVDTENE